jgi:hypothetical protein
MCAAFTPQWTYDIGLTTHAGLRQECGVVLSGLSLAGKGQCHSLSHTKAAALSKCCVGDVPKFTRYLTTVEAFSWIGVVSMAFASATTVVGLTSTLRVQSWAGVLHFLNILGVISFIIALVVALSMFEIHGPRKQCESTSILHPCAYMGTAAIVGIVALALSVFGTFAGIAAHALPRFRNGLLTATLCFVMAATGFAVASSLTPSWVHFMSSPDAVTSTGTLQHCAGTNCRAINFASDFATTCHGKDVSGQVKSRFAATTAMMVIGSVAAAGTAVAAVIPKMRVVRVALLLLAFAATAIGLAVIGSTYDYWLLCGESYFGANPSARWGASFGFAVFSAIALGMLVVLHVADAMWASAINTKLTNDPVSAPRGASVTVTVKA